MKRCIALLFLLSLTVTGFAQETPLAPYTIFSNLGTGNDKYYPGASTVSQNQFIAAAFTPSANAEVTKIAVAITHNFGTRRALLSLNSDASGQPGTAIYTWLLTHVPSGQNCCKLLVFVAAPAGLTVTQGTPYWLVAEGLGSTVDGWHGTYDLSKGLWAYNLGQGWIVVNDVAPAFGVFGKPTD
jgi:hypothetical protein